MAATTTVNFEKGRAKFRDIRTRAKERGRNSVKSWARLAAIECAKLAAPRGTGADAQNQGEAAVARDIYRVYGSAGSAHHLLPVFQQALFWRNFKAGNFTDAENRLRNYGLNVQPFDGGAAHKAARNKRGRVSQHSPSYFIIRPNERRKLEKYIKEEQSHVGTGKGGWADAARQIGSIRGLRADGDITANWILRKSHGLGFVRYGGTDINPTVTIGNSVVYAAYILDDKGKRLARFIAKERVIKDQEHRR